MNIVFINVLTFYITVGLVVGVISACQLYKEQLELEEPKGIDVIDSFLIVLVTFLWFPFFISCLVSIWKSKNNK